LRSSLPIVAAVAHGRIQLAVAVLVWLASIGFGSALLWEHDLRPGAVAAAPARWPAGSSIARTPGRATLLLLLHPRCPCGRASVAELERLMARHAGELDAYLLLAAPDGAEDWLRTDVAAAAARIPGAVVLTDPSGREAARFGAITSGQVLVYAADGGLVFSGGITPARGHVGQSLGGEALETWLSTGAVPDPSAPVFGCSMPVGG
jgi:hypothetical protein